jgi:hypothetical protein
MRIQFVQRFLAVLAVAMVFAAAQEPVKPKLNPRIITATKQVTIFTALENQMLQSIQKKDKTALETMLTDESQIQMPDSDPLSGDDWVDSVVSKDFTLKSFVIRQMSAVDLGGSVVVNYDRIQEATYKDKPDSGEFYVVDLWKKSGDSWKLANRYVAKVNSVASVPKPVRPTGKQ